MAFLVSIKTAKFNYGHKGLSIDPKMTCSGASPLPFMFFDHRILHNWVNLFCALPHIFSNFNFIKSLILAIKCHCKLNTQLASNQSPIDNLSSFCSIFIELMNSSYSIGRLALLTAPSLFISNFFTFVITSSTSLDQVGLITFFLYGIPNHFILGHKTRHCFFEKSNVDDCG